MIVVVGLCCMHYMMVDGREDWVALKALVTTYWTFIDVLLLEKWYIEAKGIGATMKALEELYMQGSYTLRKDVAILTNIPLTFFL